MIHLPRRPSDIRLDGPSLCPLTNITHTTAATSRTHHRSTASTHTATRPGAGATTSSEAFAGCGGGGGGGGDGGGGGGGDGGGGGGDGGGGGGGVCDVGGGGGGGGAPLFGVELFSPGDKASGQRLDALMAKKGKDAVGQLRKFLKEALRCGVHHDQPAGRKKEETFDSPGSGCPCGSNWSQETAQEDAWMCVSSVGS